MTRASFRTLTPAGLTINGLSAERGQLRVVAHSAAEDAACPACGRMSGHVHSRYWRQLLDLPAHGRVVRLRVQVHRVGVSIPPAHGGSSASRSPRRLRPGQRAVPRGWKGSFITSASHWAAVRPQAWRFG